jgi:hypothetical protein
VVQLEAVELALWISYGLTVCRHLRVDIILVLHDLIHNQIRVAPDFEAFDPELDSNPETVDHGFILSGIV